MKTISIEVSPSRERIPGPRHQPRRRWTGILLVGLCLAGGYGAWTFWERSQSTSSDRVLTAPVERQTLTMTVSANGEVEPELSVNVSPESAGILQSLLVQAGETVQSGQVLARMKNGELQAQVVQAQGNLNSALATLEKILAGNRPEEIAQSQAGLSSAQANLQQAVFELQKYQQLFQAGAVSALVLEQKRTQFTQAQANLEQQRLIVSVSQQGSRWEDIAQAQAQVLAARGSLQAAQARLDSTVIRAPFAGLVSRIYADPGSFVTPTTSSSSESSATSSSILALTSRNQVVAKVAEADIAQIRVGQLTTLEADAYLDQTFQGQVTEISPQAVQESNVTSFEVTIAILNDRNTQLRSGMNVSVEFEIGVLPSVLTVPTVAIVRQTEGTGVYVEQPQGKSQFVPITTGASVGSLTQVKSGLSGSERVLLTYPSGTRPNSVPGLPFVKGSSGPLPPPPEGL